LNNPSFHEFKSDALAHGFDEVLERHWAPGVVIEDHWAPGVVIEDHTHPFSVSALVVQGEMWLTVGEHTQHLRSGDRFELEREVRHAERYGREGATYWVARRNAAV
jgi:AraC-like ligand binding domain